jgi:phosphinothricin acetyltransferase
MELLIRTARLTDVDRIQTIYADHVLNGLASFEETPPDHYEISRRLLTLTEEGYPYYVAVERDSDLAQGYAYAGPYRARSAYRHAVEDSIYLSPTATGRGLGKRLLAALIEACEGLGKRQMIAVIGDSKNEASIRLHRGQGFRLVGTLQSVGYKHGRWVDSVLMQRILGEGDLSQPRE